MAKSFKTLKDPKLQMTDKMPFGKFKDCRICDIIEDNYEYLIWLSKNSSVQFSAPVMENLVRLFAGYLHERHHKEEIVPWLEEDNYEGFEDVPY